MTFLLAYLNVNFNFNIFVYGSWICIFFMNTFGNRSIIFWCCHLQLSFDVQLLNQWESPGSPPATKEDIDNLPLVTIAQEHIGMCWIFIHVSCQLPIRILLQVYSAYYCMVESPIVCTCCNFAVLFFNVWMLMIKNIDETLLSSWTACSVEILHCHY